MRFAFSLFFDARLLVHLAASVSAAAWLAFPAHAADKEFRDWWAACDNLRNCSAYGFDSELSGRGYLRIARQGAAAAKPVISIAVDAEDGVKFKLAFDDPSLPGLPVDPQSGEEMDATDMRRVDLSANGETLLASLRKAKEIIVTRIDPPGKKSEQQISKISLNGAIAALLWVDDQQKRVDTVTAFIKRGDKPETSIPPQPKAPAIVAAPGLKGAVSKKQPIARDLAAIGTKATSLCGEGDEGKVESATALSSDTFLYAVQCPDSSGAYNFAYTFLVAAAGQPQAAKAAVFQQPQTAGGKKRDPGDEDFRINADFSNVDMTMRTFAKGRGIGDCGEEERWVWNGKTFQLAELRSMPHCRGVPLDDWPSLYRADVKQRLK